MINTRQKFANYRILITIFAALFLATLTFPGSVLAQDPAAQQFSATTTPTSPGDIITDPLCIKDQELDKKACEITNKNTGDNSARELMKTIGQTLVFFVVGISVIMVVVGGLLYTLSGGDGNNTKRAKDVILYAIVGLVVALGAQGIVTFVLGRV